MLFLEKKIWKDKRNNIRGAKKKAIKMIFQFSSNNGDEE